MNVPRITIGGNNHTTSLVDRFKPFFRQDRAAVEFFEEIEKKDIKSFAELLTLASEFSQQRRLP